METFLGIMIPFLGTALGSACVFFMKKSRLANSFQFVELSKTKFSLHSRQPNHN